MFDYKKFKKEMEQRGHKVWKRGNYIDIKPNNNYFGYHEGFSKVDEVIAHTELEEMRKYKAATLTLFDNDNTFIYKLTFRIKKEFLK